MKRIKVVSFLVVIVVCVVCLCYYVLKPAGIKVRLFNKSSGLLSDLSLEFTGGSYHVDSLSPKEIIPWVVNPSGESNLIIKYVDASKRFRISTIDTYFERGYSGSINIYIGNSGNVSWEDNFGSVSMRHTHCETFLRMILDMGKTQFNETDQPSEDYLSVLLHSLDKVYSEQADSFDVGCKFRVLSLTELKEAYGDKLDDMKYYEIPLMIEVEPCGHKNWGYTVLYDQGIVHLLDRADYEELMMEIGVELDDAGSGSVD
jgi:hypothetical protein